MVLRWGAAGGRARRVPPDPCTPAPRRGLAVHTQQAVDSPFVIDWSNNSYGSRSLADFLPQKCDMRGQAPADCPRMHAPCGASRDPKGVPQTTAIPNASCSYCMSLSREQARNVNIPTPFTPVTPGALQPACRLNRHAGARGLHDQSAPSP
eukprot:365241-Chlamydomonas_euryale.AAC.10